MSKRLVLCCDGTWNSPDQKSPTNVTKVALAVAPTDASGREQRTFYHRGVGTNRWERLRGGAFGFGLSRNVCDAYRFLVQNFEPGDELFFFGFSRGAYTARSTAGFVRNCGILRREHADRVDEAYALYRDKSSKTHPRGMEATLFRRSYSHETRIHFVGVWDTVGALGIPLDGPPLARLINRRWEFHDTKLSGAVDAAYQALAIDEKRPPFRPTLWEPQENPPEGQHVEQVWFAGVHCDVGGGYPEHETSDIPLLWMVNRARSSGLTFCPDAFAGPRPPGDPSTLVADDAVACTSVDPDALGLLHESREKLYRVVSPYHRSIGVTDEAHEYVASSASLRHDERTDYRPGNLDTYLAGNHRIMPVPSHLRSSSDAVATGAGVRAAG
ncbi:MAG TPA: DUF2235 domain-containing protein [Mycobacterium sp.]|jgi:uncharacterized protein (DUF2235 family)|nr:DUF2235 domain-containing protein [Mycobacterium sp.]